MRRSVSSCRPLRTNLLARSRAASISGVRFNMQISLVVGKGICVTKEGDEEEGDGDEAQPQLNFCEIVFWKQTAITLKGETAAPRRASRRCRRPPVALRFRCGARNGLRQSAVFCLAISYAKK